MATSDLRQRLRVETQAVHERLHQHRYFAALADGTIDARDFDQLMARMGGFYAALDPQMIKTSDRTRQGVYRYYPRAQMFPKIEVGRSRLPPIKDLAALTGAAYVVDGSVLGGQLLRRTIQGRLSHQYWDWCASHGPSIWRSTRALIDLADSDPKTHDRAVAAAQATFSAFSDHMDMILEEVPA